MELGGFGTEILYSFIIIVCSLMIYFGTRELYNLSSHKGIKYFRMAFLFFAIAYFFRSFIKFIIQYFNIQEILEFSPQAFGPVSLFLFMYFSSMAIFYLLYSVMWRKLNGNSKKIFLFHLLAIIISIVSIASRDSWVHLGINLFLFIFVAVILYIAHKNKHQTKGHRLYTTYILLFIFWILNIIDILIPRFLHTYQLFIYLASSLIFLIILYKVIKKIGST